MKVYHYIFLFLMALSSTVSAQLYPRFNQYMTEGLTINPAFAGSREVLSTAFFYKNNWVGFDGAPIYQTLSAHTPLKNNQIGIGVLLMHEQIGIDNNYSLYFNYAYRASLRIGKLAFGLKGGIELTNSNYGDILISPRSAQDPVFNTTENFYYPNFGVGVYYYTRKFFAGASVPLLLSKEFTQSDKGIALSHDFNKYNYFFTSGYKFSTSGVNISPAILISYHNEFPFVIGGNVNFDFLDDRFTLGAGYSNESNSMIALAQIKVNEQLRIGYSYDTFLSSGNSISRYINGSHEIMLRYEFRYIIDAANPIDF
jgi:type IX secretion system PorP/SprF family membrane protein